MLTKRKQSPTYKFGPLRNNLDILKFFELIESLASLYLLVPPICSRDVNTFIRLPHVYNLNINSEV